MILELPVFCSVPQRRPPPGAAGPGEPDSNRTGWTAAGAWSGRTGRPQPARRPRRGCRPPVTRGGWFARERLDGFGWTRRPGALGRCSLAKRLRRARHGHRERPEPVRQHHGCLPASPQKHLDRCPESWSDGSATRASAASSAIRSGASRKSEGSLRLQQRVPLTFRDSVAGFRHFVQKHQNVL